MRISLVKLSGLADSVTKMVTGCLRPTKVAIFGAWDWKGLVRIWQIWISAYKSLKNIWIADKQSALLLILIGNGCRSNISARVGHTIQNKVLWFQWQKRTIPSQFYTWHLRGQRRSLVAHWLSAARDCNSNNKDHLL